MIKRKQNTSDKKNKLLITIQFGDRKIETSLDDLKKHIKIETSSLNNKSTVICGFCKRKVKLKKGKSYFYYTCNKCGVRVQKLFSPIKKLMEQTN